MSDDFLKRIDWHRPWLAPLQPVAERVLQAPNWRDGLNQQAAICHLTNHLSLPIQFVPQSALPEDMAYESFISATGCVPTRDNLHDFFNALVWLTFPRIKARLNALQSAEIIRRAASPQVVRGKIRDAATIFDENAVLLLSAEPDIGTALREHKWQQLFLNQRHLFETHTRVYLFGHALMEKLVTPYKAITGHTWVLNVTSDTLQLNDVDLQRWVDSQMDAELQQGFSTAEFAHLPVLGVPGWWSDQDEAFYADKAVFRPVKNILRNSL
jgi:hypothetical protein